MDFKKRYILGLIPLILVGSILYYFSDIVTYVVLAWVLSMIGAPMTTFLRKYVGKTLASLVTLAAFVVGMGLLVYIFIPPLVQQARNLAGVDYDKVIKGLEEPISDWENWLINKGLIEGEETKPLQKMDTSTIKEEPLVITRSVHLDSIINSRGDTIPNTNISLVINIQNPNDNGGKIALSEQVKKTDGFFDRVKKSIYSFINPSVIPQLLSGIAGWVGNILITLMSVLFIAFFFLREQGLFNKSLSAIVPNKFEDQTNHAIHDSSRMLIRYFTGIIIQIITITIFMSIVLSIVGIKNALLIGFFAALMNVIPYIGPILGASFAIIITLSSNLDLSFYEEMFPMIVKVIITFMVMQLLDNFILQPNIFSKSVKAHPLEIFIVVLVGAKVGGIAGMVLAIPIYTVLRVIAKVFLSEFKVVQSFIKSMEA